MIKGEDLRRSDWVNGRRKENNVGNGYTHETLMEQEKAKR